LPPNDDKETPKETPLAKLEKDPTRSTGSQIVINLPPGFSEGSPEPNFKSAQSPTVIGRWEMWLSILMFSITTGVQQNVIPEGKWTRIAMWVVSIAAQVGIVFGRPLLIRGTRQTVQADKVDR